MASLFIRDSETADIVRRLARRTGKTQTALVRELASTFEAELDQAAGKDDFSERLREFYRRCPPTSPAVAPDHKAVMDELWGVPD